MRVFRRAMVALLSVSALAACSTDQLSAPDAGLAPRADIGAQPTLDGPAVVISQVYGGGGNSGATFTHDFIELFNRSDAPVDLSGWSVQYASATGTNWNATALSGTIAPGGYYLVQQAAGTGGTTPLPTPDAIGGAAMSATAGKVVLSNSSTALTGACPVGSAVIDRMGFGTGSGDAGCSSVWGNRTPSTSNTTGALRLEAGCRWTGVAADDFSITAPTPRNSASPSVSCGTTPPPAEVARVEVTPTAATLTVGGTITLAASAFDVNDVVVPGTTFTWASNAPGVATVTAAGLVTAVAEGQATITVAAPNGVSATAAITVGTPPTDADVVISQIYGGGGNAGAPLQHDFIELFNAGSTPVSLSGWSVQYSSAAGTSWQVTPLEGTIQPGGYFLVQQAAGSGTAPALPTPDVVGSIPMSATAGKVLLVRSTTAATVACPTGGDVVDRVGFGVNTTANGCESVWGARTAQLSNSLAAFRKNDGCVNTGIAANDFDVLAPLPRNSASPLKNCQQPPREQSAVNLQISELMGDPVNAESASWGEWFEVYNFGTTPVDLQGFTILSGGTNQPPHVINQSVIVPPAGYVVLGRGADPLRNGGVTLDYNYFVGNATTIWLDDNDWLMLIDGAGARIDSVAWTSLPRGVTKALSPGSPRTPNVDAVPWKFSTSTFGAGDYGTPGALNTPLALEPPFVSPNRITISGRTASDAPLPVGFESQLFATLRDGNNVVIPSSFTWESLTPAIGSIESRGVIRALAAGTARFRATAEDGTTRVHALTFELPVASSVTYGDHLEFGAPVDGDMSDDFILPRREFVTSWNGARGIPNWVAYQLAENHIVPGQDRCNCFTFDPLLEAAGFAPYTTADYTGAGAFAGYGIDRGHLARSFDRTAGSLDNARTFYFSNIIPQAADVNQGPWAEFENFLGNLARNEGKEVYIYTGASGSIGTVKGEGRITIPEWNWKVAVVVPAGRRLADITRYTDLDAYAVLMPNQPGIRNDPWPLYSVTIDSIEALSGYDVLSLLRDDIEIAIESGTKPPSAVAAVLGTPVEWSPVRFSAAASTDPDGDVLRYEWAFNGGTVLEGEEIEFTFERAGRYPVRLIAIDPLGLADTAFVEVDVQAFATARDAIERLEQEVLAMAASGALRPQDVTPLLATVRAAAAAIERGDLTPALQQLTAFQLQVQAMQRSRRLTSADGDRLLLLASRAQAALRPVAGRGAPQPASGLAR